MEKPILEVIDPTVSPNEFTTQLETVDDYIEFGIDTVGTYIDTKLYFDEMLNDGNYLNDLQDYEDRILAYYNEQYSQNASELTDGILNNLSAREMEQLTIPLTNAVVYQEHNDQVIAYYNEFRGDRTNAEVYNDLKAYLLPLLQGISRILATSAGQVFTEGTDAYNDLISWSNDFQNDLITAINNEIDLSTKITDANNAIATIESDINIASNLESSLEVDIQTGATLYGNLSTSITEATSKQTLLANTNAQAQITLTDLEDAIATGTLDQSVATTATPTFVGLQLSGGSGDQGTFSWNAEEQTADLIQNGSTLQLGQETQVHCKNNTASTITNGSVVMATGTLGASGRITIAPATTSDAKFVLGIATEDIISGDDGKVSTFGKVRYLDTSMWSEGDILYLDTSNGTLTNTEPTSGLKMSVAIVINSHASNGTIFVRITPVDETQVTLSELGVTATTTELNKLDGFTGSYLDLNYAKDLKATGVTATEFDYLDGVTSSIQTQLNSKVDSLSDLGVTATSTELNKLDGFTGSYLDLNYAKDLRATGVTSAEFDYLDGVTSNIQTQLNSKQASGTYNTIIGTDTDYSGSGTNVISGLTLTDGVIQSFTSRNMTLSNFGITATSTELNYTDGVTSNIQTQLNGKQATLVSGSNIKTVNGSSILGGGDLVVGGGGVGEFKSTSIAISSNDTALSSHTGTSNCIAIGTSALASSTTGYGAIAIGDSALELFNEDYQYNVAIGANALTNLSGSSTSNNNTSVGNYSSWRITNGQYNTALGTQALQGDSGGSYSKNTAIGSGSLYGHYSGDRNVALGYRAMYNCQNTYDSIIIGADSGFNVDSIYNCIVIGTASSTSSSSASNEITLGNTSITSLRCNVQTISSLSDARDKDNVQDLTNGLDVVNALRPVSFTWNMRDGGRVGDNDNGFIAQELKQVQEDLGIEIPNLVSENNPDRLEASYGALLPTLVKAIQELSAKVTELENKIQG